MNENINSANNPKKGKPRPQNLDLLETKSDNNLTNNCNEDANKIKKIPSPKSYRETNAKTQMDIKKNIRINEIHNSYKTQNMSSPDNIYKEIRRPLNNRNNTNTLTLNTFSSNANSNYKSFAEKIQNLDIKEHTENSFISPETEVEAIITNANCEAVKPEDNIKSEQNKGNETKENNLDLNRSNSPLALNESNYKNSVDEKSKKINYRFESPFEENDNNNMDANNNNSNLVLPSMKINYSKNSETLKTNREDKWDNKSHSHYINKPTDKINNSMISNLSYKSHLEQSLKISISNGIIDINQYEMAMSSTKNNEAKAQVTGNLKADSKENNPPIDFISSIINNRNLINKENRELNVLKDCNDNNILVDYNNEGENYEKLVNNENDKARNNTEGFKTNNRLVLSEKHLGRSSSNYNSNSNECNLEEFSSHYCNDISTDKQYTLEKQFNENQQLYINSMENKGDLSSLKEDRRIKRNKSSVQSFVQLNKSDVGKLIQTKIQKESANKKKEAARNNSFSMGTSGNSPEKQNSSHLKNEMLQRRKTSISNTKLVDLNQISEITEETTGPNIIYYKDSSLLNKNSNNSLKISRSPKSRRKRSENNKVLISKNSLYMEKVLFFVDNLQKSSNIPQKFEDEFLVLKSEKNGTHEYEKKYVVPPNYLNLKSNEIIEKNKSFKKLEKNNGTVKLFEIFSNETLDNYNKDRLMANDLDLKDKYFKNAKNNNSFNIYSKQHYLNTSLNNKMSLNNSHQINNYNYNVENGSFDRNTGGYKSYENSVINPSQQLRSFLPQPRIILRDDILKFDRERQDAEESKTTKDSFNKTNLKSFKDRNATKSNSFLNLSGSNNNNNNQTKNLENPNDKTRISRVKNSPLIKSAENVLNLKNQNYSSHNNFNNILNENDLQEYENQLIANQSSFLNKSNYSGDLKNFQNEYWQKRRSEPYKYNNNNNPNSFNYGNSGNENSYLFNESLNNNLNPNSIQALKSKEDAYRSSELQLKRAIIEKSKFEGLKNLNDKNVERFKHQKKIEFKNDVFVNRKKMDVIENNINKMVVEATHKAKDNMDLFMYNSSKDELITIEK